MYLIKRGPRPMHHKAPFHPVIICNKRKVAKWEAGDTRDRAWVWTRQSNRMNSEGFLLERWSGLDIDYGAVVKNVGDMPDGTPCGFFHRHHNREPWNLLSGAIWWDDKKMPTGLRDAGVIYPPDYFSQQKFLDFIAADGLTGFGRDAPDYWPKVKPDTW